MEARKQKARNAYLDGKAPTVTPSTPHIYTNKEKKIQILIKIKDIEYLSVYIYI